MLIRCLVIAYLCVNLVIAPWATVQAAQAQPEAGKQLPSAEWPLLPHKRIRSNADQGQIFQLDTSQLNGRKILLLIHGGGQPLAGLRAGCFQLSNRVFVPIP